MKSHLIPKIETIRVLFLVVVIALAFIKFDITRHETLVREQICSENQPATFVQKINDQKAIYIFGTCGGYSKEVSWQNSSKPEKETLARKANQLRPAPRKVGATRRQQYMINYAWRMSHGDEKFIAMVEAESKWQPHKWEVVKKDGELVRGSGYGLCQVDNRYWADIQSNPKFKANWAYQVHTCLKLWKSGIRFYGADKNNQMISRFWWASRDNS